MVRRRASLPVARTHQHPERRDRLLGIGHHMDLVTACSETVRAPIGPHADAALYGRIFADDADSHPRASISPYWASSLMNSSTSDVAPSSDRLVQSSRAASTSKTGGDSSNTFGCCSAGGMAIARGVSRLVTAISSTSSPSTTGRML